MKPSKYRKVLNAYSMLMEEAKYRLIVMDTVLGGQTGWAWPQKIFAPVGAVVRPSLLICLTLAISIALFYKIEGDVIPPPSTSYNPIRLNYRTATSCNPQDFRIAIDVGHTIEAPGALSARGVPEYTFNISLAERLVKALKDAGFDRTYLLTMRGIGKPQLIQRSVRANTLQVDLFVSVHHDDVQPKYYSSWQYNGKTLHFSDKFSGFSLFMSYINAYPAKSLRFAQLVGAELMARGMHFTTHHAENISGERRQLIDPERGVYRYDQLIVLKNTKAPSVLIEAGVIVNRAEEVLLTSPERQELFSKAVLAAANQFCGSQE